PPAPRGVRTASCIPLPDIDEVAGHRGGRRHGRADQVGAPTPALATLEIAVGRGGAALAGGEDVVVHPQAHAAARVAPLETGIPEDAIQAFGLGLGLDLLRSG